MNLVEELEEAWHKNVFDQFLIDDLTNRVRATSSRRTIWPALWSDESIGPTPPPSGCESTSRRALRSPPARSASPATSSSTPVPERGDRRVGSRSRGSIARSSRRRCGRPTTRRLPQGRSPRPPAHHRGHDRRAVVRHQGRARAQIGLKWAGVAESRVPGVEKAAAIETPAPYVSADVNDARIRIEDSYRKQGFNDVEVEIEPAIAPMTPLRSPSRSSRESSRCCRASRSAATRSRAARC